jgi:hypothetical protein
MDINALKKFIANKSPKKHLAESTIPKAVQAYLSAGSTLTMPYGMAYDAGSAVAAHPEVQKYLDHIRSTMKTGDKKSNQAYVDAHRRLPNEVLAKVAKDFGTDTNKIALMYSAYTAD